MTKYSKEAFNGRPVSTLKSFQRAFSSEMIGGDSLAGGKAIDVSSVLLGTTDGPYKEWCAVKDITGQRRYSFDFASNLAVPVKWQGEKTYGHLRANTVGADVEPWSLAAPFSTVEAQQDPQGMISEVKAVLGSPGEMLNYIAVQEGLIGGLTQTGYDGVAFFSTAHPYGNGTTFSNKNTLSFTADNLASEITAMEGLKDESGRPLGLSPTHIIHGTGISFYVRETIGQSMRMYPTLSASGPSAFQGILSAVVEPLIGANDWYLVDAKARPIRMGVASAPKLTTDMDEYKELPIVHFAQEAQVALVLGLPHAIRANTP